MYEKNSDLKDRFSEDLINQLENFNALLSCKLLVVLNEFEMKESVSNKEKFKSLITNVVNVINEKHEKQRKEKDYVNYALLTNNVLSFSKIKSLQKNNNKNMKTTRKTYKNPLNKNTYYKKLQKTKNTKSIQKP